MPADVESPVEEYSQRDLLDMLPIYYKRLFPHKPFYRWLSYGLSECGIASQQLSRNCTNIIFPPQAKVRFSIIASSPSH